MLSNEKDHDENSHRLSENGGTKLKHKAGKSVEERAEASGGTNELTPKKKKKRNDKNEAGGDSSIKKRKKEFGR